MDGVTWNFCIYHDAWLQHRSDKCRNNPKFGKTEDVEEKEEIQAAMASAGIGYEDSDSEGEESE